MSSAKKFRFVSPGVYISEIDKSQIARLPAGIGPTVIGRSARGPSMIPITVNSYLEFVQLFGEPTRGTAGEDTWRSGESSSPLYATYAAKAFLKNSSPLTFVRLVGDQSPTANATDIAQAGWTTVKTTPTTSSATNGGAFGLFIVPSGNLAMTGTLAAVWYLNEGAVRLVGLDKDGNSVTTTGGANLVKSTRTNSGFEFRAQILNAGSTASLDTTFNFLESSSKYVRKVFNTNPTLANSSINSNDTNKTYWLGESFATFLSDNLSDVSGCFGFIAPLVSGNYAAHDFLGKAAQSSKTGWVISQDLSTVTGSYSPANMTKLFRFATGETAGGEWEQKNIKVSITDIKPSTNQFNKYGSFTVQVRDIRDTDSKPVILETFTGCTLDPNSSDFIANKIGDEYLEWDTVNKKYNKYGNFSRKSEYIRVIMNPLIENGGIAEELLPFGFYGPPVFNDIIIPSGSTTVSNLGSLIGGATKIPFSPDGTVDTIHGMTSGSSIKIVFPTLKNLVSASSANTPDPRDAFYGPVFNVGTSTRLNEDVLDLVRAKPDGIDSFDPTNGLTKPSFIFSLDDIVQLPSSSLFTYWASGSRAGTVSINGNSVTALAATSMTSSVEGYKSILDLGIDSFTMPLYGATDALNVREKDPFRNSLMTGVTSEDASSAIYTLKKAVDTVRDPEVMNMNLLTIPGVTNSTVTSHVIATAENRGDTLAIVDIEGGYVPSHESSAAESSRRGSVTQAVQLLKDRAINSSYACTYYPWVKILDDASGLPLWVPPSVVALGTMASSQESTEVWFAPAGFNRGGLTNGSAGLSVVDVREKLSSKDRDKLYEVNINPIASFPNEGIVIFGQKTLQVTQSALDRINVRRLMIYLKKEISVIASSVLFDQNIDVTWNRFKAKANPLLESVQSRFGITEFKLILDETTTTPDLIDRNIVYAKIYIKPARAIEFIAIDFIITRTGASFED